MTASKILQWVVVSPSPPPDSHYESSENDYSSVYDYKGNQ